MWEIHGQNRKRTPKITTAIASVLAITTVVFSYPAEVSAAGGTILPVEVFGKDVVSVGIPVVPEGEKSPFDFILDPQGLIYEPMPCGMAAEQSRKGRPCCFIITREDTIFQDTVTG